MWNLSPVHFIQYTIEDGNSVDETLNMVVTNFIEDIKTEVGKRGMKIEDHHFIQHNPDDVPKNLKLTFETREQAKKFLNEDTSIRSGVLLKRFKKPDEHIPIRQCKICRNTNHRAGDYKCTRVLRCPRCLSRDHSQPTTSCRPMCWTHKEGHSSGSDRCPINIKFKKDQRTARNRKSREEAQLSGTHEEYREFHRDMIQLKNTIKS